jgi:hypothetical protein
MKMNRKITFYSVEKKVPIEKIVLKKLIGYAPKIGILIFEDTITEEWIGIYTSTGAKLELKNKQLPVVDWRRDQGDELIEETKKIYEFIKPPPKKNPIHAPKCGCNDCKELNAAIKSIEGNEENK